MLYYNYCALSFSLSLLTVQLRYASSRMPCYLSIVIPRLIFIENNTISLPFQVPCVIGGVFFRCFSAVFFLFFFLLLLLFFLAVVIKQIKIDGLFKLLQYILSLVDCMQKKTQHKNNNSGDYRVSMCVCLHCRAAIQFCGCHFFVFIFIFIFCFL